MIRAHSGSPLQGLVSGSLDLDKIEYLRRDARFCGVPYGEVDVDRLLHALTLVRDPATGRQEVGVHEKGLSALESLLFAKYQMFRNVYWHHAVRAATSVYKRLVQDALDGGVIRQDELVGQSDERLLATLEVRAAGRDDPAARRVAERWLPAIRERRLPKRALELPGEALRGLPAEEWLNEDAPLRQLVEARLEEDLGLEPGGVFLDYPEKPGMLGVDLLLLRRDGSVHRRAGGEGAPLLDLPRATEELYYTARAFRVFTTERRKLEADAVLPLLALPPEEIRARLAGGRRAA
jgi:hypothetical protein